MKWITALNLESWANTIIARPNFPALIADLIRASAPHISSIRFPNGDKGQVRGFDGVLDALGVPPYVPDGESIWEFGVSTDPLKKAETDFSKRTNEITKEERLRKTFVFISPRSWDNPKLKLDDWLKTKRDLKEWKGVEYIDGVKLEAWLDCHPAVAAKYARYELKTTPPSGAISTDEFWDEYSTRFKPALTEDVILCGRNDQAKRLVSTLMNPLQSIYFAADSPDEVLAFAVAAIRSTESEVRSFLEAKTIIVETAEAARLLGMKEGLIFLPRGQARNNVGILAKAGCVVISAGADESRSFHEMLSRPGNTELGKALAGMFGVPESEGFEISRKCGRSLTVLARQSSSGTAENPEWLESAKQLIPAFLAGGWSADYEMDQEVLQQLGNVSSYDELESPLRRLSKLKDPPLDRVQDIWKIRAPVDAFTYLAPNIGNADLQRLKSAVIKVFGQMKDKPSPNDLYRLPSQRDITHSSWLKEGLMTTLLLISSFDVVDLHISGYKRQQFVDEIVRSLWQLSSDSRFITSLQDQLPLLAEAAPIPFLDALECLLKGDAMVNIFSESNDVFAATSPHVSLLWALEVLAWDSNYLLRVAIILARLATVDPGGRVSNRPINTLRAIFLTWFPNTNASLAQRNAVLKRILDITPEIGWDLLVKLFPKYHDHSSFTERPKFREAQISGTEALTYALVWEAQRNILDMAIDHLNGDAERLNIIIGSLTQFDNESKILIMDEVDKFLIGSGHDERIIVYSKLKDESNRNHRFKDSEWALDAALLSRLDNILEKFRPIDTAHSSAWLFNDWFPYIPNNESDNEEVIRERRVSAISDIISESGLSGMVALLREVKIPHLAISAIAELNLSIESLFKLMEYSLKDEQLKSISVSIFSIGFRVFGEQWIKEFSFFASKNEIDSEKIAILLTGLTDTRSSWEVVETFGVEVSAQYWQTKHPFRVEGTVDDTLFAASKYIEHGRVMAAVSVISSQSDLMPDSFLFNLLDAAIPEINSGASKDVNVDIYHIELIFESLNKRETISERELAKLEFAYLPIFDSKNKTLTLHRMLIKSPELYVDLISAVFKPASRESQEPTEGQVRIATAAYGVLRDLKILPGQVENDISFEILSEWCIDVRARAVDADRVKIVDQYIGKLLAHAPKSNIDDAWPHESVRLIIELFSADEIEKGLELERYNMRGVYCKAVGEGGDQERALASNYFDWAGRVTDHPRTHAMLTRIGMAWSNEADRADIQAQKEKLQY